MPEYMEKIKYITNKDLLSEIKICKASFCTFLLPEYATYDTIVTHIDEITPERVAEEMLLKVSRLATKVPTIGPIAPITIVFRVMTDDHLPPIDEKKRRRSHTGHLIKTNFNPFRHFILQDGELIEVGRSHWLGDFETGVFNVDHGKINNRLANMFILLVEQYSRRGNWRGYCISEFDQALSQRGWVGIDEINEDDIILSYDDGKLKWSKIESIYRSHYEGKMFHITGRHIDALVTPGHKFVTDKGLTKVEYLKESDRLLLMGKAVEDTQGQTFPYSDAFVELIGWFVTEGNCHQDKCRNYVRVAIYQNDNEKADRIRKCLTQLDFKFGETRRAHRDENNKNIQLIFTLPKELCNQILAVAKDKILSPAFIMALSSSQRTLLIDTMIDGDGTRSKNGGMVYAQKNPEHIETFLMLCTLSGYKTTVKSVEASSFGKPVSYFLVTLLHSKSHVARVISLDFHGAKRKARTEKLDHPNEPTVDYNGRVWCPKTDYGTFVTRRNNVIYVTGNTYVDEMRSHAMVQLAQVGLQFDESRSANPFAFFTQIIKNCLAGETLILTREYGSVPIERVSGQDVTLLDGNGDWIKSHVYDYGIQETINLNFFGNCEKISIRSTLDHGWVQQDTGERIETKHFMERNGNATKDIRIADLRPTNIIKNEVDYRRGVIHGLIYGDGSAAPNCANFFFMRLCSEKVALESWLSDYPKSYAPSHNGDPTYYLAQAWCDLKALPMTPGKSLDYLRGFLRGWVATDGCVSTDGVVTLCTDTAEKCWLEQWAPLIGWHFGSFTLLAEETNYGKRNKACGNLVIQKRSMIGDDFLREKHRERWIKTDQGDKKGWRVYPANQDRQNYERRMERVYCPDVQTTHTLALASGIHSFQCFRRILNLEHRAQTIRDDLLIMAGAMPSYTRQVDNEIDQREGSDQTVSDKPSKRGRKPKATA